MHQKCYQCKTPFFENSSQYNKRTKVVTKVIILSPPICKDCNRINLAESRAKSRVKVEELPIIVKSLDDELYEKLVQLDKEYPNPSNVLVQRRLRVNYEKAKDLLDKLSQMR